mmetsp:Transcript_1359/g.1144  ORF Transcript_1359/g.1144 Transcript_1359/m.1144 type:complete len:104 (-) Transcript_1359:920-1231(-)
MHKINLEKSEAESTSTVSIETINENDNLTSFDLYSSNNQSNNRDNNKSKPRKKREFKHKADKLCLFCDEESEDIESNLIHMFTHHTFKVPYPDEVSNMHELIY